MSELCPCGSNQPYRVCCEPYHQGTKEAPTAEALMRARYAAYTKVDMAYVARTMRGKPSEGFDPQASGFWAQSCVWQKLVVQAKRKVSDTRATVEFTAQFLMGDEPHHIHEISVFEKDGGQWFYVDSEHHCTHDHQADGAAALPKINNLKLGRNEPCYCGSGKKYKKCCLSL